MKRYVIVGLGNFGSSVAESLHSQGHEVIVIDTNETAVDNAAQRAGRAAVGDGRNLQTLERIGAKGADAGIVSTGDDITASILATMALKDLGIPSIYVKVVSKEHARVMERIGVSETVFPERESALALGRRITATALLNYVRLGSGFSIQEMAPPQAWNHKTLRELNLRAKHNVIVVAIHDVLTDSIASPNPDDIVKDSDTLLIAGKDADLARIAEIK
jgi:trk system potassium uptake protein TrkA